MYSRVLHYSTCHNSHADFPVVLSKFGQTCRNMLHVLFYKVYLLTCSPSYNLSAVFREILSANKGNRNRSQSLCGLGNTHTMGSSACDGSV